MDLKSRNKTEQMESGFTLIEMLVSLAVFTVVVVFSLGSIVSVLDANQKSQTLRSVMDNLNVTMEGMSRKIRFGQTFHCGSGLPTNVPSDCATGDSTFTFISSDGTSITYKLSGTRIARSINGGPNYYMTSSDTTIEALTFYVTGSASYNNGADTVQPRVVMVIKGYSGLKSTTKTSFTLETLVSQRKLDS